MKKIIITILLSFFAFVVKAQDQTINGNLTTVGDIVLKAKTVPTPFGEWGKRLYFGDRTGENNDYIYFSRVNIENDNSELRLVLGNDGSEKLSIGYTIWTDLQWREGIVLKANGRIGIGVPNPTCALDVNGTIRAKEVKIEATGWADFVFSSAYSLRSLEEVENHIIEHQHLPDMPSEKEVLEEGVNVVEMQAKLLQKIEELTLYVIDLKKENNRQNEVILQLQEQLNVKNK